jgi:hypothetical protein
MPSFQKGGLIMNNIELRLIAERNWREENLQKCRNVLGRKTYHRPVWNVLNFLPVSKDIELYYLKRILSR